MWGYRYKNCKNHEKEDKKMSVNNFQSPSLCLHVAANLQTLSSVALINMFISTMDFMSVCYVRRAAGIDIPTLDSALYHFQLKTLQFVSSLFSSGWIPTTAGSCFQSQSLACVLICVWYMWLLKSETLPSVNGQQKQWAERRVNARLTFPGWWTGKRIQVNADVALCLLDMKKRQLFSNITQPYCCNKC